MTTDKDEKAKPPTNEAQSGEKSRASGAPPAGPHAKPDLVNPEKTPGAGALPAEEPTGDVDAGVG